MIKSQLGPLLLSTGMISLLIPIIINMSFYNFICLVMMLIGFSLSLFQIQIELQQSFDRFQYMIQQFCETIILDDLCQTIIQKIMNENIIGSIMGSFGLWFIYTFPFTEDQRLQWIHFFALPDETEDKVRDIMHSPGGVFRYFLTYWNVKDGEEKWENVLSNNISNRNESQTIPGDLIWEHMDHPQKQNEEDSFTIKDNSDNEESSSSYKNHEFHNLLQTKLTKEFDRRSYERSEHSSTYASTQYSSHCPQNPISSQDQVRETPMNPTSMIIDQTLDFCDDNSNDHSNNKHNDTNDFPKSQFHTAKLITPISKDKTKQTFQTLISNILRQWIHQTSKTNIPQKLDLDSSIMKRISFLSSIILLTHLGYSKKARQTLSVAIHALAMTSCISISGSTLILHYAINNVNHWKEYRYMIAKYLLSTLEKDDSHNDSQNSTKNIEKKNQWKDLHFHFGNKIGKQFISSYQRWKHLVGMFSLMMVYHLQKKYRIRNGKQIMPLIQ